MKWSLSRWFSLPALAGLLALGFAPAFAQTKPAAEMGKIHGQIINPTGNPQPGGKVGLSTDGGVTYKYTFDVSEDGNYSGEAAPGNYSLIYISPNTPPGKYTDEVKGVKIVAGQDIQVNDDMSRQEYIDKMSPEDKKQLEEMKKNNAEALKANALIKHLNDDLKAVAQDKAEIDAATKTAQQQLGASATKADLAAKVEEIKTAKYTDIESMMTRDTAAKPDEAILWTNLGFAQDGLKKYDDAIASYKKAIDLETASKKPRLDVLGQAEAGLGSVYARTGKVQDANTAFDAAAKDDPKLGPLYLHNEAIIFFQQGNTDAQVAAAEEATKLNPDDPILYYLIGNGLVQKATMGPDPKNPKEQIVILPPGCAEAYQKYLELAPDGAFASDVKGILQSANQPINSTYKAHKH